MATTPSAVSNAGRQSLFSFLRPSKDAIEERAFREHYLKDDIQLLSTVVFGALAFMIGLTANDFVHLSEQPGLELGIQIRVFFIALGGFCLFALFRFRRPLTIDLCALVYSLALAIGILMFHLNSDPGILRMALIATFFIFLYQPGVSNLCCLFAAAGFHTGRG